MKTKRLPTSFLLSMDERARLAEMAEAYAVSQSALVRVMLNERYEKHLAAQREREQGRPA